MKLLPFLFLVLLFMPHSLASQTIIDGTVTSTNDKAVEGVIITLMGNDWEIISYTTTDKKGYFKLNTDSQEKEFLLNISLLGYTPKNLILQNKPQSVDIYLEPSEIQLKEVIVKSDYILSREDTLIYSVNAFRSQEDRTIGDILKKLPGVEVSRNGGIKYNGEPINKFYIEGLDLLDRKYGIATNNVPVDAVMNVEVIENHQPVKTLKDIIHTGQAAINIKLKNGKMDKPVGTLNIGAGGFYNFLWNISAFALQAQKEHQTIVMYKTNNAGDNIANELTEQSLTIENPGNIPKSATSSLLQDISFSYPRIERNRYLFNKTHLVTVNRLWKRSEDNQIRINISYLNDTQNEFINQNSSYLLLGENLTIFEDRTLKKKNNILDGIFTYTNNSSGSYLNNKFGFQTEWNKTYSAIKNNNNYIGQKFNVPEYNVNNELNLVKKSENRILNISSLLRYSSLPSNLKIDIDTLNPILQNTTQNTFYTKNSANISFSKGKSRFYLESGIEGAFEHYTSDLFNHPDRKDSTTNNIESYYLKASIDPIYSMQSNKAFFSFGIPVAQHIFNVKNPGSGNPVNYYYTYIDPHASFRYKFNQLWEINSSFRYYHTVGDISDFMQSYIIVDYRTFHKKTGILSKQNTKTGGIRLNYRNILTTLFFNAYAGYSSTKHNLINQQLFSGDNQSVVMNTEDNNNFDIWMFRAYIGKYLGNIKTSISLSADYNIIKSKKIQQGIIVPLTSGLINLNPSITTKITDFATVTYQANITKNKLKILSSEETGSSVYQISQKLAGYYFFRKKLELKAQLEYIHNDITPSLSANMVFADLGIKYLTKNIEYTLNWNNIFNKKIYSYTIYNYLDTYNYFYRIRPVSILGTISFKF